MTKTNAIDAPLEAYESTSREDFEALFPAVVDTIMEHVKQKNLPEEVVERFKECLYYNTRSGKLNRGLSVPDTGRILLNRPLNAHESNSLCTLGWLTELLQAFFLVHDDIMDHSITRRGQKCWYQQPKVGLMAVNDAVLLESSVYAVLKSQFRDHPAYIEMVETFQEAAFNTQLGQLCDLLTAPEDSVDLDKFSMERYATIVQFKTAYYSFYLPVVLALHWVRLATPRNLQLAHDVLMPMGEYFQVQDDYLDLFGDTDVTGKIGTDIRDNKCSWLVNQALLLASPEQRRILDECYGRKDGKCEMNVRQVFVDLDLPSVYAEFEKGRVRELKLMIEAVDEGDGLRKDVFGVFLAKICKRLG
ncbi:farnesyl-pyrophosphate synthetase [Penicillium verhagenii]|nr:farnesyl-pyrophosphate synthetase [Penicillium verhagenii]